MKDFLSKRLVQFLLLLGIILAAHAPLLIVHQIRNPDAANIYSNLEKLNFPAGYFSALSEFNTYDFQPVRDITFYIDIWSFEKTGLVFSILLNCLIWSIACLQILRITEVELNIKRSWPLLLFVSCFAVYPVFGPVINWGIARKHLLAFLFITSATHSLIVWEKEKGSYLKIIIFYLLSVLSVPIAIAWPLWAFFRVGGIQSLKEKHSRSLILSLGIIAVLLAGINFAYYKTSTLFLETYVPKATKTDWSLVLAHLGFQFKQLFFPYHPEIFYQYEETALYYFGVFFFLILVAIYFSRKNRNAWTWILYGTLPMLIMATTPQTFFDSYLIIPAFAVFMLIMTTFMNKHLQLAKYVLIPGILWFAFTLKGHTIWTASLKSYEESFTSSPNCTNAVDLAYIYYQGKQKLPHTLFQYLKDNVCVNPTSDLPPNMVLRLILLESMALYYEDFFEPEFRLKRLEELSKRSLYTFFIYAAFLAKVDAGEQLEELMKRQNEILKGIAISFPYDPIFSEIVPAYCREKKLPECLEYVKRFKDKPLPPPYF